MERTFFAAALMMMAYTAAADSHLIEDRIRACAGDADDARRLACYDRAAASLDVDEQEEAPQATSTI